MALSPEVVESKSIAVNQPGMNVDPDDVDNFLALAEAGVIGGHEISMCGAVQDNLALRRETRTTV